MPRRLVKIGPCLVDQSVRLVLCPGRSSTVTVREVILVGTPSYRYDVGSPGTSTSWNGVNRYDVDTVCDHAMCAVWPMLMSGTPSSEPPATSSWPGIVSWVWKKRSDPIHGKCGLPRRRPWPLVVALEPRATALEPIARVPSNSVFSRCARAFALIVGIGALGSGGWAAPMPSIATPE